MAGPVDITVKTIFLPESGLDDFLIWDKMPGEVQL
jgi:hypothetical protein